MLPSVQFVFPGMIIPNAPADMYMALGKNDQKIHVVPSKNWVVVRLGDSADESPVPVVFDSQLWTHLNDMTCVTETDESLSSSVSVRLNHTAQTIEVVWPHSGAWSVELLSIDGKIWQRQAGVSAGAVLQMPSVPGVYVLQCWADGKQSVIKFVL
jgi:hypothetical protein